MSLLRIRSFTSTALALAAAFLAPQLSSTTHAQAIFDVRIDFRGFTPAPSNATWNTLLLNTGAADLLDYAGASTGVSMTVTSNFSSQSVNDGWSTALGNLYGDDDWLEDRAAKGYWYTTSTTTGGVLVLEGLDNEQMYRIDLIGSYGAGGHSGIYKVNGVFANATFLGDAGTDFSANWNTLTAYNEQDWMIFSSITPVGGSITIEAISRFGSVAPVNALRLSGSAIPEPSTYAILAGVAMLGFAYWRRRQNFAVQVTDSLGSSRRGAVGRGLPVTCYKLTIPPHPPANM